MLAITFFVATIPNVNYQSDSINDSINDLGLDILKYIKEKPGINAPTLTTLLTGKIPFTHPISGKK